MSEMKHTPGPWHVREFYIYAGNDPYSLAEVKSCQTVPAHDIETHKANARLIAAAPDLLQACQELLIEMRAWNGECEFDEESLMKPMFDQLKAAIAKATAAK